MKTTNNTSMTARKPHLLRIYTNSAAALLAAGSLLALCSPSLQAASSISATASGSEGYESQTASSGSVSAEAVGSGPNSSNSSRSRASFGVLRVYSEAHTSTAVTLSTIAGASAAFRDDFTIGAPGQSGSGFLTFGIQIDGSLASQLRGAGPENDVYGQSYSQIRLAVFPPNGGVDLRERLNADDGSNPYPGQEFLNQTKTIVVQFTFGVPFEIWIMLNCTANVTPQFGADSVADAENTLRWGGIVSVTDSGGNPVSGYTVSSTSGTDYRQPIPEPGTYALFISIVDNERARITWPTNATGYTLQFTTGLPAPAWTTITNTPAVIGDQFALIVDTTVGSKFYRLRKP